MMPATEMMPVTAVKPKEVGTPAADKSFVEIHKKILKITKINFADIQYKLNLIKKMKICRSIRCRKLKLHARSHLAQIVHWKSLQGQQRFEGW